MQLPRPRSTVLRRGPLNFRRAAQAVLPAFLLIGCAAAAPDAPGTLAELPGWTQDQVSRGFDTFVQGCARPAPEFAAACAAARQVPPGDEAAARAFVLQTFQPSQAVSTFVSGYYEPEILGSRTRDAQHTTPVLRPPPDPGRYDRGQIRDGALNGRDLEIAYVRSVGDLWLMQLQGNGRLRLADGSLLRLGHAGENGYAALPPAELFADADIPGDGVSGPGIRAWMARNPSRAEARIRRDPNYVFFNEVVGLPDNQATTGALGIPLTPLRSIAADPRSLPLGTPVWLEVDTPGGKLRRLMVVQDTGGLVQGPAHLDLYFGWGPRSEVAGGLQHATGRMWALRPRDE